MINRRLVLASLSALGLGAAGKFGSPAFAQEAMTPQVVAAKLLASPPSLGERSMGPADAPVVMVAYGSTTCEHSAEFSQAILPQLRAQYIEPGKLRFVFRELPLDNLALATFILVRSLPEDKYFPILDMLWKRQKLWRNKTPKEELFRIMQMAGMTRDAFESSIQNKDIAQAIFEAGKKAQADFAIKKTPAIFVNGRIIEGHESVAEFTAAIDSELAS